MACSTRCPVRAPSAGISPAPQRRRKPAQISSPRRSRHRPFVFSTSGRVSGPVWIPSAFACTGSVRVRVFLGRRLVAFSLGAVQPNCTFATTTVVTHKPGHGPRHRRVHLRLFVRYLGSGYLGRALARPETVVVG